VVPHAESQSEAVERLRLGLQIMALRALGDPDAADEAVQETLVRTLEALRGCQPKHPEKLGAVVRCIARHVIINTQSARRRRYRLEPTPPTARRSSLDEPLTARISAQGRESACWASLPGTATCHESTPCATDKRTGSDEN
jgi:DNA-directed RNA polymerase specialized sigma24 family protein